MTASTVDLRLPFGRQLLFGLQHVLIMYTGCITVPLVFGGAVGLDEATIAILINADLLIAGLITVVQSLGLGKLAGVRLPIVTGATFSALTPMILIAQQYGLPAVYGSMMIGGLVGIALAWPFAQIIRFFPPLVTGSVLTVVGVSLIGVAGGLVVGSDPTDPSYANPIAIGLAAFVLLVAIGFICIGRGIWTQLGVLIALIAGALVAWPLGLLNFAGVGSAPWFGIAAPFHFGAPEFPIAAVVAMSIVMVVVFAESTASIMAVGEITGTPVTKGALARGLVGDGLSGVLGGAMNAFIDTVFSQNVGAVATTRVYSRYVTATSGVILILLGLVPKMGGVIAALPQPVVGGVGLILFAVVAVVGINTLRHVDLNDKTNITIAAVAIGIGLLPTLVPGMFSTMPSSIQIIFGSGITLATITAFVLNLLLNHGPLAKLTPPVETSTQDHPDTLTPTG